MGRGSIQNDEFRINDQCRSPKRLAVVQSRFVVPSLFVIGHSTFQNMKTPLEAPPEQVKAETGVTEAPSKQAPAPVIDTSKMSKGQREALELAEASRDPLDERGSFASNLFIGRYDFERIFPYPNQTEEDRAKGDPFLNELRDYLAANVDGDEIDS